MRSSRRLTDSGSSFSATAVYPERSANRTVTVRRSSSACASAATLASVAALASAGATPAAPVVAGAAPAPASSWAPQFMQKRACPGALAPQALQRRSSAAPQDMQKRAPAGFSDEHSAQRAIPTHLMSRDSDAPITSSMADHGPDATNLVQAGCPVE